MKTRCSLRRLLASGWGCMRARVPDALVALGVLQRYSDGPGARYANTPAGTDCPVRGTEGYIGGLLEFHNDRQFRLWEASIMPTIASANIQAPAVMIGEFASRLPMPGRVAAREVVRLS